MFLARKFERRSSDVDCDATSPCVHSPRSPLFICVFGAQTQKQTHINVESKFHLTALRFDSIPFSIWFCFCFWTSALGLQFFSLRPPILQPCLQSPACCFCTVCGLGIFYAPVRLPTFPVFPSLSHPQAPSLSTARQNMCEKRTRRSRRILRGL